MGDGSPKVFVLNDVIDYGKTNTINHPNLFPEMNCKHIWQWVYHMKHSFMVKSQLNKSHANFR